jgi:hypothetical protein
LSSTRPFARTSGASRRPGEVRAARNATRRERHRRWSGCAARQARCPWPNPGPPEDVLRKAGKVESWRPAHRLTKVTLWCVASDEELPQELPGHGRRRKLGASAVCLLRRKRLHLYVRMLRGHRLRGSRGLRVLLSLRLLTTRRSLSPRGVSWVRTSSPSERPPGPPRIVRGAREWDDDARAIVSLLEVFELRAN